MKSAPDDALVGRTIAGKFLIEGILGSGAMGIVYKAKQLALDKTVALKVMHAELANDATFASRFQREAKAASKLDHPNSVRVLDYGEAPDGLLYIAMEYLAGRDLLVEMRQSWPMSGERIIDILTQALSALAVAHDAGIIHRDLKPENILVLTGKDDEGNPTDTVKVCDFGIAKITNDRGGTGSNIGGAASTGKGPLTSTGAVIGTPEYMSPEQGKGDKLDPRSDIYSMGVILYQMLTGRVPFQAENSIGVILKHITDDAVRPTQIVPTVDPRLEAICMRAMQKKPDARYASAREMRADLRAVREQARGGSLDVMRNALPSGTAVGELLGVESQPTMVGVPEFNAHPSKGTPAATEVPIVSTPPRPSRRPLALVALAMLTVGAVGAALFAKLGPDKRVEPVPVVAATGTTPAPEVSIAPLMPLDPTPPPSASQPKPHAVAVVPHPAVARSAPASSKPAPPPSPVVSASVAPAPAPPPTDAPPSDPGFDPNKGTVTVGLVTPNNVNADAVRSVMSRVPFTPCYRNALRARAMKAAGAATLSLSIDETGHVNAAVLTGNDWLPEMTRCVQGAAAGQQLTPGAVEAGGGTADVFLSFRIQ